MVSNGRAWGYLTNVGQLVRCVSCGEVQWNLRAVAGGERLPQGECRICGAELDAERRRPGRHFDVRLTQERRDVRRGPAA
jgi:hypothetical protein